jgi:hypothetical protein
VSSTYDHIVLGAGFAAPDLRPVAPGQPRIGLFVGAGHASDGSSS